MLPLPLGSGLLLGWGIGANDSANVFGTAVASRVIKYRTASFICGTAVILGASLQGTEGIHTYHELANYDLTTVTIATMAAAISVIIMNIMSLPISTSQAIVGAIAGIGLSTNTMNWSGLEKIIICWIATPLGAMVFSIIIYHTLFSLLTRIPMSMLTRDKFLWSSLVVVGAYGSYALGANNVANATGIFSGQFTEQGITDQHLALIGGIAIAIGSVTYSKKIMLAVGSGIMPLDAFTGLVAVSSMAITLHIFALIGVPVSTTQGLVGAIIGIGIIRGTQGIRFKALRRIMFGWLMTPILALILASSGYAIFASTP